MRVLVTGGAGFIGSHVAVCLARRGDAVTAADNFLDNYAVGLKDSRRDELLGPSGVAFREVDLADREATEALFADVRPDMVVHLAARPGVREGLSSLNNYLRNNVVAFGNVLEFSVSGTSAAFVYASSSSVYGDFPVQPLVESALGIQPKSYYGATKLADELITDAVIRQSDKVAVGLRFFTVYGPWGRPDMLPWRAVASSLLGRPLPLFGDGSLVRDFTYIDDVVEAVARVTVATGNLPPGAHRVLNVGGGNQRSVRDLLDIAAAVTGGTVPLVQQPAVAVDVAATLADSDRLFELTGYRPSTRLEMGIEQVARWMRREDVLARIPEWSSW